MIDPTDILNWRRIDQRITTSGQPTEDQLAEIEKLGVTCIINLGPHSNKGALSDEPGTVAALGMRYIYIPVDFEAPTQKDFDQFRTAMADVQDQMVHVHCIYNARVSAFFYMYLQQQHGVDADQARVLMESIWCPGGAWAALIGDEAALHIRNLYAGEDY